MADLFSVAEIIEITGGRARNISAESVFSVSIDSRTLEPGALFVAIKGERFDGHDYVAGAIRNGAAVALVSKQRGGEFGKLPVLVVPDALEGLGQLGVAARARSGAKIAAITGSVGKTTVKEMVRSILSRAGKTHASIRSYNNHWGVPLMLAGLPKAAEFGVFEIGMNHAGEITPLSNMVCPHVTLITNIGSAHIGNFKNMEGIARAKGEIFSGMVPGGAAIVNGDHAYVEILRELAEKAGVRRFVTYGFDSNADIVLSGVQAGAAGSTARVGLAGGNISLDVSMPGRHMLANALGALCVGEELGVDTEVSLAAIAEFSAPAGR
ncbi:MAG TPA: UDP-N-acetylmuramoyl-tripeptide--D-alanyl-D-alanine ligase, partial [Devosia sp.]|nr:UDP-N-acetylmuramoyl-tripeptide--D-alanyl-D-alanine ligase [Devosia sp.]